MEPTGNSVTISKKVMLATIAIVVSAVLSGVAYFAYRMGFESGYSTAAEEITCDGGSHIEDYFKP